MKKNIEQLVKKSKEKKEECSENHKEVFWNSYSPRSGSSYSDKVNGMCRYCLTSLERPLNEEERQRLKVFRDRIYNNMTTRH